MIYFRYFSQSATIGRNFVILASILVQRKTLFRAKMKKFYILEQQVASEEIMTTIAPTSTKW